MHMESHAPSDSVILVGCLSSAVAYNIGSKWDSTLAEPTRSQLSLRPVLSEPAKTYACERVRSSFMNHVSYTINWRP